MRQAEYHTKIDVHCLSSCTWKTSYNQAVSLRLFPLFRSAVPVPGGYQGPFHSHFTALKSGLTRACQGELARKISNIFFALCFSHLHTVSSCVRSVHPQCSFISLHSAGYVYTTISTVLCLPPYIFLAVAPSRSHRGATHNLQLSYWCGYCFFYHTYLLVAALNQERLSGAGFYPPFHAAIPSLYYASYVPFSV
jgi:hypothetical protein